MSCAVLSLALALALLILATMVLARDVSADPGSTIDFEGLAEGSIVDSVASGSGISGDAVSGSVDVFGFNPDFGEGTNAAMIFDAECTGGCSGGDDDLNFPGHGNILIISEDLDGTDPDDADVSNSRYDFDFADFGSGTVFIGSLVIMDVEKSEDGGGTIQVFNDGSLVAEVAIPITGDHDKATVAIGATGDFLRINVNGSAAVDNIEIEDQPADGDEACSPGFWRNHLDVWPDPYDPSDDFDTTFGVDFFTPDITLLDGIEARGGGKNKLARFGVAALLNAAHPDVDFPLTEAEVIALVQSGDPNAFDDLFDDEDCPLTD